ncbi:MAG: nucleoside phosphorylase [Thermoproteus sp.]
MPYHIKANRGDIADTVIGVGDPARAQLYAEEIGAELVNANRYPVYTGNYRGMPITIVAHGIGAPSIAIALEELKMLGMRRFVRIGTAGALADLKIGDVVVASAAAAAHGGGVLSAYMGGACPPLAPSPILTAKLYEGLKDLGAVLGPVVSSDAFYAEAGAADLWRSWGAVAVEMECAAAMMLGWLRGFETACVLVVSNVVGREETADLRDRFVEVFKRVLEVIWGSYSSSVGSGSP